MTHLAGAISALLLLFFGFGQPVFGCVVSEIMYDAPGSDTDKEWVEIKNNSPVSLSVVTGSSKGSFRFFDGSSNRILNDPVIGPPIIPPDGFFIIAKNPSVFLQDHPSFSYPIFKAAISLRNSSSTLKIINGEGLILDEVMYLSEWGGNGDGKTLSKIILSGENSSNNWRASDQIGGTPGMENFSSPASPLQSLSQTPSTPPLQTPSPSQKPTSTPSPSTSSYSSPRPTPKTTISPSSLPIIPEPSPSFPDSPLPSPQESFSPLLAVKPSSSVFPTIKEVSPSMKPNTSSIKTNSATPQASIAPPLSLKSTWRPVLWGSFTALISAAAIFILFLR